MTRNRSGQRASRLQLEHLEDRSVPSTFTVNTTLDDVTPANGKFSLREAISKANSTPGADVIVVPAGVFKITIAGAGENANLTGDFDVTDGVTVRGAGAGATIIDAQRKDRLFDLLGSVSVKFADLTLRHSAGANDGGAVQALAADVRLVRCVVSDNQGLKGGGINAEFGNVTVVDSVIARNVVDGNGGGLNLGTGALTLSGSTVRRNLARLEGGGFLAFTATLTNSTVSGNSARGGGGGGILTATETLTNCTVSGNSASDSGGGIESGTVTLTNCTVSGNIAGSNGGGIEANTANLTNCTVSGNSAADSGGGIEAITAFLLNVTVAENSAHTGGGLFHGLSGMFNLRNTIVALNLVDFNGTGPDVSGAFQSQGHILIGDGNGSILFGANGDLVGTSASPIDPKLGPLQNNGGKTQTMALKAGSPAIDHGDNSILPPTDQRGFGFARKKDGNGDGLAIVDIGAFER